NFFSQISPQLLLESFIRGAEVEVSDGVKTHRLKEYEINLGGGFSIYYYSTDSTNLQTAITGEVNKSYSLKIITNGEEYTATTTIPAMTRRVDSLWWKPMPNDTSGRKVVVMIRATDPPGYGDYVRYWTKKNSEPFYPGFNSVFDDLIIDGTTYELEVEPGLNRNEAWNEDKRAFRRGDTVTLKLSNIDKATYDFWRTMEYSYASIGNPFSTPVKVTSNISNNALGYFGGYATQYHQLIIPR
ncbi:MAG TPA: DUF4249 family protein, partial [Chitinophagaceae bacterium]